MAKFLTVGSPKNKTKLCKEVQDIIVKHLREGHFRETAANLAGIHVNSFFHWMRKGEAVFKDKPESDSRAMEKRNQKYLEFYLAVLSAEAAAEDGLIQDLLASAKESGDWRGLAWVMERRYPDRWGRRQVQPAASQTVIAAEGRIVIADGSKENYLESLRRAREGLVDQTVGITQQQQQLAAPVAPDPPPATLSATHVVEVHPPERKGDFDA